MSSNKNGVCKGSELSENTVWLWHNKKLSVVETLKEGREVVGGGPKYQMTRDWRT